MTDDPNRIDEAAEEAGATDAPDLDADAEGGEEPRNDDVGE